MAAGSHLTIDWAVEGDLTTNMPDECNTTGNYDGDIQQHLMGSPVITNDGTGVCQFPFRYMGILYYGCTYTDPTDFGEQFCATEVDVDYNAEKLAVCNEYCPRQRKILKCFLEYLILIFFLKFSGPRLYEHNAEDDTSSLTEGTTTFSKDFKKPLKTNLLLWRSFPESGRKYTLIFKAINNHNEEDEAVLTWNIISANPINPDKWTLTYPTFLRPDDDFYVSLIY